MEDLRSSRRPAKSSGRGDVFGGAPKDSAPFADKSDDYAEIFGGIATTCSIPFLDLPPSSVESLDAGGSVDYSEIFGGFSSGDFAIDYEELFCEKKKTTAESSGASSNGRAQTDARFGQKADVSDRLSEDVSKDYGDCLERNKFSSSSNHADDGSKQFMSYHRAPRGSIDDVISGKTHVTQLHAIPGYTYAIDSCSSRDLRSDNPPKNQTNDIIHNIKGNGQLNGVEQEKISQPISFIDTTNSCGAYLRTNQKDFSTKHVASEDDLVNMKHHSRSSSNFSASSGDISYSDVTYVSISDINLRTQPSKVPPPSRAPPKLTSKQEDTKTKINRNSRGDEEGSLLKPASSHQIHYKIGASKTHGLQGAAKDVEVDVSSAAAASAAAMKEAMELAQARLKSAKELMERKQDNLRSRKKLGHKEGAKFDEGKEVKASDEGRLSGVTARKSLLEEEKGMRAYALEDTLKATKAEKTSPEYEEKERCVVAREICQLRQGNGFKSSKTSNSPGEVSGEWKVEEQFYELINNEKLRVVKEFSSHENIQKKPKAAKKVNDDWEDYSEMAEPTYEFRRSIKLDEVIETTEMVETDDNFKPCNSHTVKTSKVPEETPDICILKENKSEIPSSSHNQNANTDMLTSGEGLKKPDGGKDASCEEKELNVIFFNSSSRLEEIYHDYEKNRKLHGAKEHDYNTEESSKSYVTSASYESEEKIGCEAEIPSETCARQVEEPVANGESDLYESSSHTRGNVGHKSCNGENGGKFGATGSVSEHVESGKLAGPQGEGMPVENDLQSEVAEHCSEAKGIPEELKEAIGTIGVGVTGEKMDSSKETCQTDFCAVETCEADKRQNSGLMPPAVENTVELGVFGGAHAESENGKHMIDNGFLGSEKMQDHFDAAQDPQRAEDKGIGHLQEGSRAENADIGDSAKEVYRKSQSSSQDAQETVGTTVMVENSKREVRKREKVENDRLERVRDHENEQARKIEEEKDREREREKDRLAIERATREAHERALAEARERAERIAVERATAEARQRALAESREKAEKASAEALERSLTEKALKEAKLRAERAAVERATAEARERAVEKALAEKAAADARQRSERLNTISRDKNRKDNEAGDHFRANDKEDRDRKLKPSSSDMRHDGRFHTAAGFSSNSRSEGDSLTHGDVESPLRCKARLERHQRTVERAAKALAEKNMRDILAQREQAERNRLAESLDAEVKRWSTGKEGNLRALLSTLQYILGSESGWQPIPLTDVITAAAVKKAYRKATLCVHPDKLQQRGASIQQKYICEKVFDLLKEAWNRFNSEER